ncbi:MAG: hypothetical protein ACK4J0_01040 [Candidatus Anstonellaceae archaeon]
MSFVPTYCKDLGFAPDNFFVNVLGSNWTTLVGLCLVAMSFLIIILYFLSELLREQKLKAWCKFEFFQIIFNAVLLVFISGMLYWMCAFDVSSFYKWADPTNANSKISNIYSQCGLKSTQQIITPYCVMNAYIDNLKTYGKYLFGILFLASYFLSQLVNFAVAAHPIGMGFSLEPAAGLRQFINLLTVAMSGYTLTFISLYVQEHLIRFFLLALPYYFLPIGILLRAFFPTREFGGAIIGFVIASIFFYPFTFVFADLAIGSSFNPVELDNIQKSLTGNINSLNQDILENQYNSISQSSGDPNKSLQMNFDNSFSSNPTFIDSFITVLTYPFSLVFSLVTTYFIGAAVIPLINFVIYIQAAASISQMLGSRLDITNLTRMI